MAIKGIPRTLSAARKRGFKPIKVDYANLSEIQKDSMITLGSGGVRGSLSHIIIDKTVQNGPCGNLMICYKYDNGSSHCVNAHRDADGNVVPDDPDD